jgi:hypothetical protein
MKIFLEPCRIARRECAGFPLFSLYVLSWNLLSAYNLTNEQAEWQALGGGRVVA